MPDIFTQTHPLKTRFTVDRKWNRSTTHCRSINLSFPFISKFIATFLPPVSSLSNLLVLTTSSIFLPYFNSVALYIRIIISVITQPPRKERRRTNREEESERMKQNGEETEKKGRMRNHRDAKHRTPQETELYNSTMETQWHPFYLSIPFIVLGCPRLTPSPFSHTLSHPPVHLETLHKYTITIVSRKPLVAVCPVIYRCGLMNFLFRTRFIG